MQHVRETVSICSDFSGTAGLPALSLSHSDKWVLTPWRLWHACLTETQQVSLATTVPASLHNHTVLHADKQFKIILSYPVEWMNAKQCISNAQWESPLQPLNLSSFIVWHRCHRRERTILVHCVVGICYPDHHSTLYLSTHHFLPSSHQSYLA